IRSRCQVIDLKPLDAVKLQDELVEHGMSQSNAVFLSAITNNLDEALALGEDEWFAQARKRMIQLIEHFIYKPAAAYLFVHSDWMPHFNDRSKQLLGLDMLL